MERLLEKTDTQQFWIWERNELGTWCFRYQLIKNGVWYEYFEHNTSHGDPREVWKLSDFIQLTETDFFYLML